MSYDHDQINSGFRQARKTHYCNYCLSVTHKNVSVFWWTYREGRQLCTSYAHPDCQAAWQWWGYEHGPLEDFVDVVYFREEILPEFMKMVKEKEKEKVA